MIATLQIIFAVGSKAVGGGPIAGILFVFGGGVDDGPGNDIAGGGEVLGDFVGGDGGGDVLGNAVVTIIGAVSLLQEDEGFAVIRAGTVEFQAGKFGLEVEGVAGFGFHFGSTFLFILFFWQGIQSASMARAYSSDWPKTVRVTVAGLDGS